VNRPIHFSENALRQVETRGATIDEVVQTIRTEGWRVGRIGWLECRKSFPCRASWAGSRGDTKQVRAVFAVEPARILVVTVFTYLVRTKPCA
jgi:hypothetical protein